MENRKKTSGYWSPGTFTTPQIIWFILIAGILFCIVFAGSYFLQAGFQYHNTDISFINTILKGIFWLILGPFLVCAGCELTIAVFRIHDELTVKRDRQKPSE